MKVVFCTSEVMPFAKTGGLADVCGSLPLALKNERIDVSIIMPFYRGVDTKGISIKPLSGDILFAKVNGIDVYFVKNDEFFNRDGLYGESSGDYKDNLKRFSFFSKRVLRFLKEINLAPDIIHCHDWQTSLIPIYLKYNHKEDSFYAKTKTVLTIHNLAYQGVFSRSEFPLLGLSQDLNSPEALEFYGKINLLKGGIIFSDQVTTVSSQYAREIRHKEFGCGLEGVINHRKDDLLGILNGIDTNLWNPEKDEFIEKKYCANSIKDKKINKKKLQGLSHLEINEDIPIFGFVGRLSSQKGIDLLSKAINKIMHLDVQLIFQGVGEEKYKKILKNFKKKYPEKIAVHLKFDESLAHQIYAGSDIFMIPSSYEPCGLSQMISFRYGTIPLVYKTGGLADTVMPFRVSSAQGDGFVFVRYETDAIVRAFKTAVNAFKKKEIFQDLISYVMKYDFSWATSAKEYKKLYQKCLS